MIKILAVLSIFWANTALSTNHQFSDFFNSLESLKANFTQTTFNETGALIQTTSGTLAFQRPAQIHWHTTSPNEQILLLNNNELWLIDTELEQASLQQTQDLSQTPLHWLINKPNTLKNPPTFSYNKRGIDWYTTQTLKFGFKGGLLHAISFENELGQTILITFDQLNTQPNINPNIFKLRLDPSFDVVR